MNISEAAKKAAEEIGRLAYTVRVTQPTTVSIGSNITISEFHEWFVELAVQRAIDAETARLREENAELQRNLARWECETDDDDAAHAAETAKLREENRALVEALKEAKHFVIVYVPDSESVREYLKKIATLRVV